MDSATLERNKELPILKLDFSKLVREEVTCGKRRVMAVVDTGAALTVISPELLQESQFVLRPWIGPRVVMANGEPATLLGAATISVNHIRGTATGEAVVFQMDGIDLILGNVFLRQYGKVQINYREPKASITFGDQPLAAVTLVKWVTTTDVPIPSFSVTNVGKDRPVRPLALLPTYTILLLALLGAVKIDALLVRDTVIFNEKPGVAFGESFWTVIIDLDIRPAEAVVQKLRVRLKEYSEMAVRCRGTGSQQGASAAKKLDVKCNWFERELNQSEHRLATFRDAIGSPPRHRQAVIDGGGSALKWLFGVATLADLAGLNKKISGLTRRENEIVHLMDHQATVVNESLLEIRTNTRLIQELEGQTAELTKNYNTLLGRMAERQAYMIEYFDFFINLDTAF
jgi:hypothetical protein